MNFTRVAARAVDPVDTTFDHRTQGRAQRNLPAVEPVVASFLKPNGGDVSSMSGVAHACASLEKFSRSLEKLAVLSDNGGAAAAPTTAHQASPPSGNESGSPPSSNESGDVDWDKKKAELKSFFDNYRKEKDDEEAAAGSADAKGEQADDEEEAKETSMGMQLVMDVLNRCTFFITLPNLSSQV